MAGDLPANVTEKLRNVQLCVLDVDGTLLRSDHTVSNATREAVLLAERQGLTVLLASSRGPRAMLPVLTAWGAPAGTVFVGSQGGVIGQVAEDGRLQVLQRHSIPVRAAQDVVTAAQQIGVSISWYAGDRWLVAALDPHVVREAEITDATLDVADLANEQDPPDKLMLIGTADQVPALARLGEQLPDGLDGRFSNPTYFEITATGVDKAQAVRQFAQAQGLTADQVLAMGDGNNDIPMLTWAGVSIVPANAGAGARGVADAVAPSNDHDGVATILRAVVAARSGK